MDPAFGPEAWHEFSVMVGGAFAALAGLLVVAISINLEEILADPTLARRAGGSLVSTVSPLIATIFILVPGQSMDALGWELVGLAMVLTVVLPLMNRPSARSKGQTPLQWTFSLGIPTIVLIGTLLLAGIGLLTESIGGLYWIPVTAITALFGGLMQAWILLIEIRR